MGQSGAHRVLQTVMQDPSTYAFLAPDIGR